MTTTCHVTLFHLGTIRTGRRGIHYPPCGLPVVAHGLCAKHHADRIRLGGTP